MVGISSGMPVSVCTGSPTPPFAAHLVGDGACSFSTAYRRQYRDFYFYQEDAYGRVSIKEQSAEDQKMEITAAGHQVDYWYADTISGKTSASERPEFAALLAQIRNAETLVVAKLDRLGRDAQGVGVRVKLLAARKIAVIVLQLGKLDRTSPASKMMMTMLAAVVEMDSDLLVERTPTGLARVKSEGKTLGRPSKITAEQRADIIAKYVAGESISALARMYEVSRRKYSRVVKPA